MLALLNVFKLALSFQTSANKIRLITDDIIEKTESTKPRVDCYPSNPGWSYNSIYNCICSSQFLPTESRGHLLVTSPHSLPFQPVSQLEEHGFTVLVGWCARLAPSCNSCLIFHNRKGASRNIIPTCRLVFQIQYSNTFKEKQSVKNNFYNSYF